MPTCAISRAPIASSRSTVPKPWWVVLQGSSNRWRSMRAATCEGAPPTWLISVSAAAVMPSSARSSTISAGSWFSLLQSSAWWTTSRSRW
jgi:hypothetical protein